MIVVDTNVASELMKPKPSPVIVDWLSRKRLELYTTSITLAEIEYGVERLPDGRRKQQMRSTARRCSPGSRSAFSPSIW